ncbi:MAG: hypothetical protein E6Q85_07850 [Thiothrix sp.]|nr:MAG: hypothetical protein E6Q85_07850 [Thiothrix sp.]
MDVHIKDAAGNVVVICPSDRVVEQVDRLKQFGLGFVLDQEALNAVKTETIKLIEQKAAEFHMRIVGTNDKTREMRFALNLECAKRLLAGQASISDQQMLQMQWEANQAAEHPVLKGKTLAQFAQWIVDFEKITMLGAGMIEATLIKGRALINTAQTIDEVEQVKIQLAQEAERIYQELIQNNSTP